MTRDLDIRIRAARERGFVVEEGGEVVAALTTRAEVAQWIEDRLGGVPGEREQEQQDMHDAVEAYPNVIRRARGRRA